MQLELQAKVISIEFNSNGFEVLATIYLPKDHIEWQPHYDSISMSTTLDDKLLLVEAMIFPKRSYLIMCGQVPVMDVAIVAQRLSIIPYSICDQIEKMIRHEQDMKRQVLT